jgi:hypothetical protein
MPLHPPRRNSQAARYIMSQGLFATIRKTFFEISQQRDIPARLLDRLENQLIVLCTTYHRQKRSESSRARRDIKSRNRHKRAQALYVDIFDEIPHLFLPVILVATPRACEKLKANEFRSIQTGDRHIELHQSVRETFEEIAGRNGLEGSPHYRKLIRTLFPLLTRSVTTAENGGYEYLLPDIQNVCKVLGDRIFDFLLAAPMLSGEPLHGAGWGETFVPRNSFQDAIIQLRVGQANEPAGFLFPAPVQQISTDIMASNCEFVWRRPQLRQHTDISR